MRPRGKPGAIRGVALSSNERGCEMRIILAVTAAAIMVAAIPSAVSARRHKHLAHHRLIGKQKLDAQALNGPQTTQLGGIRYYGGPKSPMRR